jgi:hypothetical protein
MDQYGFSMTVLHRFLDTARAYLDLVRPARNSTQAISAVAERRSATRLQATCVSALPAFQKTEYRENAPA